MPGKVRGLYMWCLKVTSCYEGLEVKDLTGSWKNGLAFCALINRFRPDLIDYYSLHPDDIYENNNLAFSVAEERFGILRLLDPEDMVTMDKPDRYSVATYLANVYDYFKDKPMYDPPDPPEGYLDRIKTRKRPLYTFQLPESSAQGSSVDTKLLKAKKSAQTTRSPEPKNKGYVSVDSKCQSNILKEQETVKSLNENKNVVEEEDDDIDDLFNDNLALLDEKQRAGSYTELCLDEIEDIKSSKKGAVFQAMVSAGITAVAATTVGDDEQVGKDEDISESKTAEQNAEIPKDEAIENKTDENNGEEYIESNVGLNASDNNQKEEETNELINSKVDLPHVNPCTVNKANPDEEIESPTKRKEISRSDSGFETMNFDKSLTVVLDDTTVDNHTDSAGNSQEEHMSGETEIKRTVDTLNAELNKGTFELVDVDVIDDPKADTNGELSQELNDSDDNNRKRRSSSTGSSKSSRLRGGSSSSSSSSHSSERQATSNDDEKDRANVEELASEIVENIMKDVKSSPEIWAEIANEFPNIMKEAEDDMNMQEDSENIVIDGQRSNGVEHVPEDIENYIKAVHNENVACASMDFPDDKLDSSGSADLLLQYQQYIKEKETHESTDDLSTSDSGSTSSNSVHNEEQEQDNRVASKERPAIKEVASVESSLIKEPVIDIGMDSGTSPEKENDQFITHAVNFDKSSKDDQACVKEDNNNYPSRDSSDDETKNLKPEKDYESSSTNDESHFESQNKIDTDDKPVEEIPLIDVARTVEETGYKKEVCSSDDVAEQVNQTYWNSSSSSDSKDQEEKQDIQETSNKPVDSELTDCVLPTSNFEEVHSESSNSEDEQDSETNKNKAHQFESERSSSSDDESPKEKQKDAVIEQNDSSKTKIEDDAVEVKVVEPKKETKDYCADDEFEVKLTDTEKKPSESDSTTSESSSDESEKEKPAKVKERSSSSDDDTKDRKCSNINTDKDACLNEECVSVNEPELNSELTDEMISKGLVEANTQSNTGKSASPEEATFCEKSTKVPCKVEDNEHKLTPTSEKPHGRKSFSRSSSESEKSDSDDEPEDETYIETVEMFVPKAGESKVETLPLSDVHYTSEYVQHLENVDNTDGRIEKDDNQDELASYKMDDALIKEEHNLGSSCSSDELDEPPALPSVGPPELLKSKVSSSDSESDVDVEPLTKNASLLWYNDKDKTPPKPINESSDSQRDNEDKETIEHETNEDEAVIAPVDSHTVFMKLAPVNAGFVISETTPDEPVISIVHASGFRIPEVNNGHLPDDKNLATQEETTNIIVSENLEVKPLSYESENASCIKDSLVPVKENKTSSSSSSSEDEISEEKEDKVLNKIVDRSSETSSSKDADKEINTQSEGDSNLKAEINDTPVKDDHVRFTTIKESKENIDLKQSPKASDVSSSSSSSSSLRSEDEDNNDNAEKDKKADKTVIDEIFTAEVCVEAESKPKPDDNIDSLKDDTELTDVLVAQIIPDIGGGTEEKDSSNIIAKPAAATDIQLEWSSKVSNQSDGSKEDSQKKSWRLGSVDTDLMKKAAIMSKIMAEKVNENIESQNKEATANNQDEKETMDQHPSSDGMDKKEKERAKRMAVFRQLQYSTRPTRRKLGDFDNSDADSNQSGDLPNDFHRKLSMFNRKSVDLDDRRKSLPAPKRISSTFLDRNTESPTGENMKKLQECLPKESAPGSVAHYIRKLSQSPCAHNDKSDDVESVEAIVQPAHTYSVSTAPICLSMQTKPLHEKNETHNMATEKNDQAEVQVKRRTSDVTPSSIFAGRVRNRYSNERPKSELINIRPKSMNLRSLENEGESDRKEAIKIHFKRPERKSLGKLNLDVKPLEPKPLPHVGGANDDDHQNKTSGMPVKRQDSLKDKVVVEIKALETKQTMSDEEKELEERNLEVKRKNSMKRRDSPRRSLSLTSPTRPTLTRKDSSERVRNIWQDQPKKPPSPDLNRSSSFEVKVRPVSLKLSKEEKDETKKEKALERSSSLRSPSPRPPTPTKHLPKVSVSVKPLSAQTSQDDSAQKSPRSLPHDKPVEGKPPIPMEEKKSIFRQSRPAKRQSLLSLVKGKKTSDVEKPVMDELIKPEVVLNVEASLPQVKVVEKERKHSSLSSSSSSNDESSEKGKKEKKDEIKPHTLEFRQKNRKDMNKCNSIFGLVKSRIKGKGQKTTSEVDSPFSKHESADKSLPVESKDKPINTDTSSSSSESTASNSSSDKSSNSSKKNEKQKKEKRPCIDNVQSKSKEDISDDKPLLHLKQYDHDVTKVPLEHSSPSSQSSAEIEKETIKEDLKDIIKELEVDMDSCGETVHNDNSGDLCKAPEVYTKSEHESSDTSCDKTSESRKVQKVKRHKTSSSSSSSKASNSDSEDGYAKDTVKKKRKTKSKKPKAAPKTVKEDDKVIDNVKDDEGKRESESGSESLKKANDKKKKKKKKSDEPNSSTSSESHTQSDRDDDNCDNIPKTSNKPPSSNESHEDDKYKDDNDEKKGSNEGQKIKPSPGSDAGNSYVISVDVPGEVVFEKPRDLCPGFPIENIGITKSVPMVPDNTEPCLPVQMIEDIHDLSYHHVDMNIDNDVSCKNRDKSGSSHTSSSSSSSSSSDSEQDKKKAEENQVEESFIPTVKANLELSTPHVYLKHKEPDSEISMEPVEDESEKVKQPLPDIQSDEVQWKCHEPKMENYKLPAPTANINILSRKDSMSSHSSKSSESSDSSDNEKPCPSGQHSSSSSDNETGKKLEDTLGNLKDPIQDNAADFTLLSGVPSAEIDAKKPETELPNVKKKQTRSGSSSSSDTELKPEMTSHEIELKPQNINEKLRTENLPCSIVCDVKVHSEKPDIKLEEPKLEKENCSSSSSSSDSEYEDAETQPKSHEDTIEDIPPEIDMLVATPKRKESSSSSNSSCDDETDKKSFEIKNDIKIEIPHMERDGSISSNSSSSESEKSKAEPERDDVEKNTIELRLPKHSDNKSVSSSSNSSSSSDDSETEEKGIKPAKEDVEIDNEKLQTYVDRKDMSSSSNSSSDTDNEVKVKSERVRSPDKSETSSSSESDTEDAGKPTFKDQETSFEHPDIKRSKKSESSESELEDNTSCENNITASSEIITPDSDIEVEVKCRKKSTSSDSSESKSPRQENHGVADETFETKMSEDDELLQSVLEDSLPFKAPLLEDVIKTSFEDVDSCAEDKSELKEKSEDSSSSSSSSSDSSSENDEVDSDDDLYSGTPKKDDVSTITIEYLLPKCDIISYDTMGLKESEQLYRDIPLVADFEPETKPIDIQVFVINQSVESESEIPDTEFYVPQDCDSVIVCKGLDDIAGDNVWNEPSMPNVEDEDLNVYQNTKQPVAVDNIVLEHSSNVECEPHTDVSASIESDDELIKNIIDQNKRNLVDIRKGLSISSSSSHDETDDKDNQDQPDDRDGSSSSEGDSRHKTVNIPSIESQILSGNEIDEIEKKVKPFKRTKYDSSSSNSSSSSDSEKDADRDSVDVKDVSVLLKAPYTEIPKPTLNADIPDHKVDISVPEVKTDLEFTKPCMVVDNPEFKVHQDFSGPTADIDISEIGADMEIPEIGADMDIPEIGADIDIPEIGADIDVPKIGAEIDVPEIGADIDVPKIGADIDVPEIGADIDVPKIGSDIDIPEIGADIDVPKIAADIDIPEIGADIDVPEIGADIDIPEIDADIKCPEPHFKVGAPEPQIDIELTAPEIDINKPKEYEVPNLKADIKESKDLTISKVKRKDNVKQVSRSSSGSSNDKPVEFMETAIAKLEPKKDITEHLKPSKGNKSDSSDNEGNELGNVIVRDEDNIESDQAILKESSNCDKADNADSNSEDDKTKHRHSFLEKIKKKIWRKKKKKSEKKDSVKDGKGKKNEKCDDKPMKEGDSCADNEKEVRHSGVKKGSKDKKKKKSKRTDLDSKVKPSSKHSGSSSSSSDSSSSSSSSSSDSDSDRDEDKNDFELQQE